uniref:Uncharacterized protein n=1 Tax=viral metagenome TaxID=1070528 RepID=A0A6C0LQE0_9ZZZZ
MSLLTSAYTKCTDENGICVIPGPDKKSIAYSTKDGQTQINYRNNNQSISCDNSIFGDPVPKTLKMCSVANIPPITYDNGLPNGFIKCADEGKICDPKNDRANDILYGANGSFIYANAPNVICSTTVFGDPAPNSNKSCYYRNSTDFVESLPDSSNKMSRNTKILIGVSVASGLLIFIIIIVIIVHKSKN